MWRLGRGEGKKILQETKLGRLRLSPVSEKVVQHTELVYLAALLMKQIDNKHSLGFSEG